MVVFAHTVGTTEVKIASVSTSRTSVVVVCNHGTATLYVRSSKGVSIGNGLPIYSYGFISMKIPEDDPTEEIWAISDTVGTPVRVYEGYGLEPKR
ncbi:unnamed protein product [marine sediment metagenome]|uniref:Uncharacterized protein n=1 Tax=marine sediment metagenome TaxID=412755 RepID=X1JDM8_9ZZZZ